MDVFSELRQLRNELKLIKGVKFTYELNLLKALDEVVKIIDEHKKESFKHQEEIVQALISLGAKIDNVSDFNNNNYQQIDRESFSQKYEEELMYIPDIEISGSVVRVKDTKKSDVSINNSSIDALNRTLGDAK